MKNPWLYKNKLMGIMVQPCTVEDRIKKMQCFDAKKLKAIIKYPHTQATVRKRAESRLKKLLTTQSGGITKTDH